MEASYIYLSIVIGMAISLIISEIFGVNPGGMIVPGYLALICDDIGQLLIMFAVSFAVYLIIERVLPHFVLLFGRRKFVATMIVGIIIKLILEVLFPLLPILSFSAIEFRGISVVTPGLLAVRYEKQGFFYTILGTLIATYLTFGLVTFLFWVL